MKKLLLFVSIVIVAASCRFQKHLPAGAPPAIKEKAFFKEINLAENEIQSIGFKANAAFESSGSRQAFKLEVRILKDSLVWLDISDPFIGIKLARAVIYKDSIAFINKIQKQFFTGKPIELAKQINLDVDFSLLQNMLCGNMIFPVSNKDFELFFGKGEYIIADYSYKKDSVVMEADSESRILKFYPDSKKPKEQIFTNVPLQKEYKLFFSNFKKLNSIYFPEGMVISYDDKGKKSSLQLKDIKNIQLNSVSNLPFSIPSNYDRMP